MFRHTTTHFGQYQVETKKGKIVNLHPHPMDQDPSPIAQGLINVLDTPMRITQPMIRKSWLEHGPQPSPLRGKEPFVAVSWDTASSLLAQELDRVKTNFGNRAIFGGSYGWASAGRFHHAQSQLHRFLNTIGGYVRSLNTYSYAAAEVIIPHILGNLQQLIINSTTWSHIANNTETFIAFGGLRIHNTQINNGGLLQHSQRHAMLHAARHRTHFINISPIKDDTLSSLNPEWLPIIPNTDTALMLALAYVLYQENLYNASFIQSHTSGFDDFLPYLLGSHDHTPTSPKWAEHITGIDAATIRSLAIRMASSRTMINLSFSLNRQEYGEYPYWAGIMLAAMLGQIGLPGGGFGLGYGTFNSIGNDYLHTPIASLPQGENPVKDFIPVARISDALLKPGQTFDYNGNAYHYPDIRLIYWVGGNPFHHHQDLAKMIKAWQKPDTIVVHEWCWNTHAKYADIVLPCTTTLERNDFTASPRDSFVSFMEKTTEPHALAKNDFAIFSLIAEKLNCLDDFTENRTEEEWIAFLYKKTCENFKQQGFSPPPLTQLKTQHTFSAGQRPKASILLKNFRENPALYPLDTPSGKIQISSPVIASFPYKECLPHPMWPPLNEYLGNASSFPLHLISNQPHDKLHSQCDHSPFSQSQKINGRQVITIHPADAEKRHISSHSLVRVFNHRGSCLCSAVISENIRPSVVQIPTGAWLDVFSPDNHSLWCIHGNPNILTQDVGTSRLSQGPSPLSCLVEVEVFNHDPPPLSALSPPPIIKP